MKSLIKQTPIPVWGSERLGWEKKRFFSQKTCAPLKKFRTYWRIFQKYQIKLTDANIFAIY